MKFRWAGAQCRLVPSLLHFSFLKAISLNLKPIRDEKYQTCSCVAAKSVKHFFIRLKEGGFCS